MCHEVQVEPGLQPISGKHFQQASLNTEDGACLDIIFCEWFWGGRCGKTLLDEKAFYPCAANNRSSTPRAIYRSLENMKKRAYQARICEVEHGTFTPIVFSATGRMTVKLMPFTNI